MEELYRTTLNKRLTLLRAGYTVIELWECEWDRLVDTDETVQQFVRSFDLVPPIDPREALGEGAVPVLWLESERRYVTWMSRLSIPGSTKTVPTPSVIRRSSPSLAINPSTPILVWRWPWWTFFPPARLFHPVLSVRSGQKLTFPLCRSCVREEQAKPMLEGTYYCHHSDADRMLRGDWCTPELVQAVA